MLVRQMFQARGWLVVAGVAWLMLSALPLRADHRVALVVGNSAYQDRELTSPQADARSMAQALERAGFRTTLLSDLERDDMRAALERFAQRVPTQGTALVYFSGYVVQAEKSGRPEDFLLGIEERYRSRRDASRKSLSVSELLGRLQDGSSSGANILILDGAYHDPALDETPTGLSPREDLGEDTLIVYAAPPGVLPETADQRQSPLATALAQSLPQARGPTHTWLAGVLNGLADAQANRPGGWMKTTLPASHTLDPASSSQAIAPPEELRPGRRPGDEWVNGQGFVFCWCPPGTFTMGSPPDEPNRGDDEGPVEVTLSRGFWLSKYELTRGQTTRLKRNFSRRTIGDHKNEPITGLHWDNIQVVLRNLNESERSAGRLPNDWEYALPHEAEWEYAARAGTRGRFSFGDDTADLVRYGNFADRSLYAQQHTLHLYADRTLDDGTAFLARVGSYEPNAWGLHDMHGNVWEFCESNYQPELVGGRDPFDPVDGGRVARGGSWASLPDYCRSAFRHSFSSRDEQGYLGARIILRPARSK